MDQSCNKHDEIKSMRTVVILYLQIVEVRIVLDIIIVGLNRPSVFVIRIHLWCGQSSRILQYIDSPPITILPVVFLRISILSQIDQLLIVFSLRIVFIYIFENTDPNLFVNLFFIVDTALAAFCNSRRKEYGF